MYKMLLLGFILLFPIVAKAEILSINQILESTCRIHVNERYGSGSCIDYENGKYYILTNGHVTRDAKIASVEFFKSGRKTNPLPGTIVFSKFEKGSDIDFALITIDAKYFGKYPPRIAKLASPANTITENYVVSAGCPDARWACGWEGFIVRQENSEIIFYPPPVGGQSGSGLYVIENDGDQKNTVLKGIVSWRVGGGTFNINAANGIDTAVGGAIEIEKFKQTLKGAATPTKVPTNYQHVATEVAKLPRYGLGSDGKKYPLLWNPRDKIWSYHTPTGITIVKTLQPVADLLPIPDRQEGIEAPPTDNPYDSLPNIDNQTPQVDYAKLLTEAKKEIASLVDKIKQIETEKEELTTKVENLVKEKNNSLSNLEEEKNNSISGLEEEKKNLLKKVVDLEAIIAKGKEKISSATTEVKEAENAVQDLAKENTKLSEQKQEVATTVSFWTTLSTILGGSTLATAGGWIIHYIRVFRNIRQQVKEPLDKMDKNLTIVEDMLKSSMNSVVTEVSADMARKEAEARAQAIAIGLQNIAKRLELK